MTDPMTGTDGLRVDGLRQWPGIEAHGGEHGTPRPSNGPGFLNCWSCGSTHAPSFVGCNAFREPCDERCAAVLGEVQCARPANHLGEHKARSRVLDVQWSLRTIEAQQ